VKLSVRRRNLPARLFDRLTKIPLLKLFATLASLLAFAQSAYAADHWESYETPDGAIVDCNGYSESGEWIPCPSSNSRSVVQSVQDAVQGVQDQVNEIVDNFNSLFPDEEDSQ